MDHVAQFDEELVALLYERTSDREFAKKICLFLDIDLQKEALIYFIRENDPTKNEINHRAFELVMT